jgi:pilus assembly protein Flp/PilA
MMARKLRLHAEHKRKLVGMLSNTKSQMKEVNEMKRTLRKMYRGLKSRKGQSLVEYALILALIAVVAILVLKGLGNKVNNTLSSVNANLP